MIMAKSYSFTDSAYIYTVLQNTKATMPIRAFYNSILWTWAYIIGLTISICKRKKNTEALDNADCQTYRGMQFLHCFVSLSL